MGYYRGDKLISGNANLLCMNEEMLNTPCYKGNTSSLAYMNYDDIIDPGIYVVDNIGIPEPDGSNIDSSDRMYTILNVEKGMDQYGEEIIRQVANCYIDNVSYPPSTLMRFRINNTWGNWSKCLTNNDITQSTNITELGTKTIDATQLNADISGTLAHQISQLTSRVEQLENGN